ncbi:hypothetical protein [Streptomyces abikoensis]|uniref:Uncharacterized protein n=1 Tax=Streptomyces abikoensis TaxID=97398 RepID=A0ABW7SW42_9ACTN
MTLNSAIAFIIGSLSSAALAAGAGWLLKNHFLVLISEARRRRQELSSGLYGVEESWADLVRFSGSYGKRLKRQYDKSKSATWYFITTDPHGFAPWLGRESEPRSVAYKVRNSDISVVWVFHQAEAYLLQRRMLVVNAPEDGVTYDAGTDLLRNACATCNDRWEVLSSAVPHFYLAFLSVPSTAQQSGERAPNGTFGFVLPYLLAPRSYAARAGLYFESSSDSSNQFLLDFYYRSITDFVRLGIEQGWLNKVN